MAEHSREVHRVFEADTISDLANLLLMRALAGKQVVGALQTQLTHTIGHGFAMRREHSVEMSAQTAEVSSDKLGIQMRRSQMPLDKYLSRSEETGRVCFILDPRAELASKDAHRQLN